MSTDVVDHCARLLEHVPTRCMDAQLLHRRATLDTGAHLPFRAFMDTLAARPDRFAVIPAGGAVGQTTAWTAAEVAAYQGALADATTGGLPLVVLVDRSGDPTRPGGDADQDMDVLTMVHGTLVDLLQASADDAGLRDAAAAGARELEAVRSGLGR